VAILRGALLSPFEMQSFVPLEREYDLTAFTPHHTRFDLTRVPIARQSLWCPLEAREAFRDGKREAQLLRDRLTHSTHSYCGLAQRLGGFDLMHTADSYYCFSFEAALAKRRTGAGLLVTQWENIPHKNERRFRERHIKRTLQREADLFLAVSEGARGVLRAEGVEESRIRKVYPGVDTGHFRPGPADRVLRKSLGIPKNVWVALFVGRLSQDKGVFTLLEAFQTVWAQIPEAHLVLVGHDEDGVGEYVEDRAMGSRVHLAGFVPYDRMPALYRQADLLVLPSLTRRGWMEQFGMVQAEAMACGVPAVGSDSGAIPEVIGDAGWVFPPGDTAALAGKLIAARRMKRETAARKARDRAVRLFSVETSSRGISAAYEETLRMIARRGPSRAR
jgi:glycosyltransferase involved in cell wall biosynthesis